MTINWNLSQEEEILIHNIAKKAIKKVKSVYPKFTLTDLHMDITATHNENNKLRLEEFLNSNDQDFYHDIFGIIKNMDRNNGKLKNFFEPRFTDYSIL